MRHVASARRITTRCTARRLAGSLAREVVAMIVDKCALLLVGGPAVNAGIMRPVDKGTADLSILGSSAGTPGKDRFLFGSRFAMES